MGYVELAGTLSVKGSRYWLNAREFSVCLQLNAGDKRRAEKWLLEETEPEVVVLGEMGQEGIRVNSIHR